MRNPWYSFLKALLFGLNLFYVSYRTATSAAASILLDRRYAGSQHAARRKIAAPETIAFANSYGVVWCAAEGKSCFPNCFTAARLVPRV